MPSDDPPSYESVLAELQASLAAYGQNLKPKQFFEAYHNLSEAQIAVLAANPQELPVIPADQQDAYTTALGEAMASDDAVEHIEAAAADASKACATIETMFLELTTKLSSLDIKHGIKEDAFTPKLRKIHGDVRGVIHQSRISAVKIANYGDRFGDIIIPFCDDEDIPIEERKEKIQEFIDDAKAFQTEAEAIARAFGELESDFAEFVGTFSDWANSKNTELNKEIKDLSDEIEELRGKVTGMSTGLMGTGLGVGVIAPALAAACALSGPVAPFVALGGLIACIGVAAATVATLSALAASYNNEIKRKEEQIKGVKAQLADIDASRAALVDLGKRDLVIFSTNIHVLSQVWQSVEADAKEIEGLLKSSKKDAARRKYSNKSLVKAPGIYVGMSKYLRQYAKGVGSHKVLKAFA